MDPFGQLFANVFPLDQKMLLSMPYVMCINRVEITLGHGQIVDRIQQVGLSGPVIPHKTIDLPAEGELKLVIVLEIQKGDAGQVHIGSVSGQK
jgi:hypothetical protein